MNELLITLSVLALALCAGMAYCLGYRNGYNEGKEIGQRQGRDEEWIENYLANERKTQAGRDKLGRFKKRKAQYGKVKITASKNEF
jgi:hypothetical protein